MTTRMRDNQLKGIFILILFILLMFQALITNAQANRPGTKSIYRGLTASFGVRSVDIVSNIARIDRTNPMATGGQVGIVFGGRAVRTRVGLLGYYASTGNTAGTTDLYESNIAVNFHPLARMNSVISPYLTGGLSYDRYSFFGYYLNQEPGTINLSHADTPFLGKIKQVNASAGIGVEFILKDDFDFIHLFSEMRYSHNLSASTQHSAFAETKLDQQMQVMLGISFGLVR